MEAFKGDEQAVKADREALGAMGRHLTHSRRHS